MGEGSARHEVLRARLAQFSGFGATAAGGVHRPEATEANRAARLALLDWLADLGFAPRIDPVGNIFGLAEIAGPEAPWIMTGSHIDSQPNGGRLDGTYGVLAGTIAAAELVAQHRATGQAACNLAVAAWCNEEGARFQPSVLGSQAYTGAISCDWALDRVDGEGISLRAALAEIGQLGSDAPAPHPAAYVELHIECGPVLDRAGQRLGVFDRWWGCRKLELRFEGSPAHTGPTPMHERRDALVAAAEVIGGVNRLWHSQPEGALHCSVGRCEVAPNSPNVVPSEVTLFVELRSTDADVMAQAHQQTLALAETAAGGAKVAWHVQRDELRRPGQFAPALQAIANDVARELGEPAMRLDTIAAHDAVPMARICPSIVLAVPSIGGICHAPEEDTAPGDLDLGLDLLHGVLARLVADGPGMLAADQGGSGA
ncbi:MAG: Zn-dependent hydrolase [Pseudomonadota bacterium]